MAKKSIFDEISVLNKYLHMSTDNFVKFVYNEVGSPKVYILSMDLNLRYKVRVNGEEVPNFIVDVPFLKAFIEYQKKVSTMDSPGDTRVVSLDIDRKSAKVFLSLVDKSQISKGYCIRGELIGGLFVTKDESNVIEVTNKHQTIEILNKYYYSSKEDELEEMLNIGNETKEEAEENYRKSLVNGRRDTLEAVLDSYDYDEYPSVELAHKLVIEAADGINCDIRVFDEIDKYRGNIKMECHFVDIPTFVRFNFLLFKRVYDFSKGAVGKVFQVNYLLVTKDGRRINFDRKYDCTTERVQGILKDLESSVGSFKNIESIDGWSSCFDCILSDETFIGVVAVEVGGYKESIEEPDFWYNLEKSQKR